MSKHLSPKDFNPQLFRSPEHKMLVFVRSLPQIGNQVRWVYWDLAGQTWITYGKMYNPTTKKSYTEAYVLYEAYILYSDEFIPLPNWYEAEVVR